MGETLVGRGCRLGQATDESIKPWFGAIGRLSAPRNRDSRANGREGGTERRSEKTGGWEIITTREEEAKRGLLP